MTYINERLRSRHPFQLYMLSTSAFYGSLGLVYRHVRPGSVQEAIGPGGSLIWALFLAVGSLAAIAGVFWRDRASGLTLEMIGCFAAGMATMFYAFAAVWALGFSATAAACIMVGFGAACVTRARQIRRSLRLAARQADGGR